MDFFVELTFAKKSLRNTVRGSNSLDPDQARRFVGPDLGQTVCKGYQQTSKFATSKERVKKPNSIVADDILFFFIFIFRENKT